MSIFLTIIILYIIFDYSVRLTGILRVKVFGKAVEEIRSKLGRARRRDGSVPEIGCDYDSGWIKYRGFHLF